MLVPVVFCLVLATGAFAQEAPDLAGTSLPPTAGAPPVITGGTTGGPRPAAPPGPMDSMLFWLLPVVLIVWIVMMTMGQKRETKRKAALLDGLKKHDRVQTVGGVIGSIVEVKPGTVVLKVDETSNTRITFAKSSIVGVIKDDSEPAKERS